MERICAECKNVVLLDKYNSHKAIQYKKKFYHFNCFNELCDKRIAHKSKTISASWSEIKASMDQLIDETTKEQQSEIAKDEISKWMIYKYDISFISSKIYIKLSDIYNGTFRGLAYPIGPIELLEEWQYYWNELCSIRQYKGIIGEQAINYDLSVLLGKNAEYRSIKEKERVVREIREQQRQEEVVIVPQMRIRKQSSKIADLYKEMNGGEGNE